MKITRNTFLRGQGKTVGQKMDEDAAFLRSIGIACEDGAPTLHEREDFWREKVRNAVLDALDEIAPQLPSADGQKFPGGWQDADLPALLAAIDMHAEKLFERHEMAYLNSSFTDPRNA